MFRGCRRGFSVTSRWNGSAVSAPEERHQQARLVLHQRLDRRQQGCVELVGERKIEQAGFAGGVGPAADVQAAAERGDLVRQRFRAKRDRLPVKMTARQC